MFVVEALGAVCSVNGLLVLLIPERPTVVCLVLLELLAHLRRERVVKLLVRAGLGSLLGHH